MSESKQVNPAAFLETTLDVEGVIKPTLKRLGITTVGQLAAFDINDMRRMKGVGQRKVDLLIQLAEESRRVLGGNDSNQALITSRDTELSIKTQVDDLIFIPKFLKSGLVDLKVNTVQQLLETDENQLFDLRGWGKQKVDQFIALKYFYREYVINPDRIRPDQCLDELLADCLFPSPTLRSLTVSDVLANNFNHEIKSGTQKIDFLNFRNLLRLIFGVSTSVPIETPEPLGIITSANFPDMPLVYIPSILQPLFQQYEIQTTRVLFDLNELKLREMGGLGGRKTQACLALQRLYVGLFNDAQTFMSWNTLGEIPGMETLLSPRYSSRSIEDIIESPDSFTTDAGQKDAELDGIRLLIGLALIRSRAPRSDNTVVSFLIGFSQPDLHWQEVPLNLPGPATKFLKKYNILSLQQVDHLSLASKIIDQKTGEEVNACDLPRFTSKTLLHIRQEILKLGIRGLTQYRYGPEGAPKSCAEFLLQLKTTLTTREFDILKQRYSGLTLEVIAEVSNLTRERVRQIEAAGLSKVVKLRSAAINILEPLESMLQECLCIPFNIASDLIVHEEVWELLLLIAISGRQYQVIKDGKYLSLFSQSEIDSLKNILNEEALGDSNITEISLREQLEKCDSGSQHFERCQELVKENDLISTPANFVRLFGDNWLIPRIKKQLVDATINGLQFNEIETFGVIENAQGLEELLGDDAEVLSDGRFRRPGNTYSKADELVGIVKNAKGPISLKEISAELSSTWKQPQIVNCLSKSRDTFQCGHGFYIHIENTNMDRIQCQQIADWGASLLAGEKGQVDGDLLFSLYTEGSELTPVDNQFLLISLIAKHKDVRRPSINSLAHYRTLDENNLLLAATNPDIAAEWHYDKNGDDTPETIRPASNKIVWWRCSKGHEYQAIVASRTRSGQGCPGCVDRWTVDKVREFVKSLKLHLDSLTPAELYVIFQQSGLLKISGKARGFVKALTTGRFPKKEIDQFLDRESSLVDEFLNDSDLVLEDTEAENEPDSDITETSNSIDTVSEESVFTETLPEVKAKEALDALASEAIASTDGEAADFLLASAKGKIWSHAYSNAEEAVRQAEDSANTEYAIKVSSDFLDEYRAAQDLQVPAGYSFSIDGKIVFPNLMQRLVAVRVRDLHRFGNWSGTGAGKTLSAILATRVTESKLTLVCCPNSVVGDDEHGWVHEIKAVYPDSDVCAKTWNPQWRSGSNHRYLVLNYEKFQQPSSESDLKQFLESNTIDFIVIDEVHYAKQRQAEEMSRRKRLVMAMVSEAGEQNSDLYVLGMSATPIINNLQEGRSLIELITGVEYDDLAVKATVPNCMKMHQRLVTLGTRWRPNYSAGLSVERIHVDCSNWLSEIRGLDQNNSPLAIEKILTQARLQTIVDHLEPGCPTLIYTHYVKEIEKILYDAAIAKGLRVGFFTGQSKEGLDQFKEGRLDVLIGSSAVGTGVDGLQKVCSQLIINTLPWTNAEYEQLIGRVWRQGQSANEVKVIIPVTYANVSGTRWSYCETKLNRIQYKKSIADAAVDGVVPEGNLRSPAQAHNDLVSWLKRLTSGEFTEISRRRLVVPLSDDLNDIELRRVKYGDFSQLNNQWNKTNSSKLFKRLQSNPEEWEQYHTLYRKARRNWTVVPVQEMINWCMHREGYEIGDFGCGERLLGKSVSERHVVYSFDHIAIDESVIEGDMSHTPLDDNSLDVAIFCLSLMGNNFIEYLRESHRVLKIDGQLHVWESTSRFKDPKLFCHGLEKLGFQAPLVESKGQFTHIHAHKTDRPPEPDVSLRFR